MNINLRFSTRLGLIIGAMALLVVAVFMMLSPAQALGSFAPGTILVAEQGIGQITMIPPGGPPAALATGLTDPRGVTVGPDGNAYVVEGTATGNLLKITPTGVVSPVLTNLNFPEGVSVDYDGRLVVTTFGGGEMIRVSPDGSFTETLTNTLNQPSGIAAGTQAFPSGGYFFNEWGSGGLFFLPPDLSTPQPVFGPMANPSLMAISPDGFLYIADFTAGLVVEIDPMTGNDRVVNNALINPVGVVVDTTTPGYDLLVTANNQLIRLDRDTGAPIGNAPFNNPSGVAVVPGETIFHPAQDQEPKRNPDIGCEKEECEDEPSLAVVDPVFLSSNEFFYDYQGTAVWSRGIDFEFQARYRSRTLYNGPLGFGWKHNFDWWLTRRGDDIYSHNPSGRTDIYTSTNGIDFFSPGGFYTTLIKNPDDSYTIYDADGSNATFYALDDQAHRGKLASLSDRNGNTLTFQYNKFGLLDQVIDSLGRPIVYSYNPDNKLAMIQDFAGRQTTFEYDANGDLVAITSPAVNGTPNGNDFPNGKTTRFTYSSGFDFPQLNHNMLTIIAPNEVADASMTPRVVNVYETDPFSENFDRVVTQSWGGTNGNGVPAGGDITLDYERLNPCTNPADLVTPCTRTTVTDRNGNVTVYTHNVNGNRIMLEEQTNRDVRPGEGDYVTTYTYDANGERVQITRPEGNSITYAYDSSSVDRRQGNLLAEVLTADGDRGGDQGVITQTYTYEPIYNRMRTLVEPRGNDSGYTPQNGGAWSAQRYTIQYTFDYEEGCDFAAIGDKIGLDAVQTQALLNSAGMCNAPLGDVNGDGIIDQVNGNVVRAEYPTVTLLANSNMAAVEGGTQQPIVELFVYNQFGQLIKETDPEANVHTYEYYSEQDPDGDGNIDFPAGNPTTGGYLKQSTYDTESDPIRNSGTNPTPVEVRRVYEYDPVGNVVREIDGRGVATDYFYNELNQVVEIVKAADHNLLAPDPPEPLPLTDYQYREVRFYDANDNVVRTQIEDRGDTSTVGGDNGGSGTAFVDYVYQYDILDNVITAGQEVSDTLDLVTEYRYDPNENRVLTVLPEGNAHASIYDERDLVFQEVRGATDPPPLVILGVGDPTDYDIRGGLTSTTTFHYDGNMNLIERVDAGDTDGSADNNSDIAGEGDRSRYIYDGFDRRTSMVDSAGNQTVYQYDPAGFTIRSAVFGPVGGPSPTSDGPDMLPMPVSDGGVIQSGNLVNTNLLVAGEYLFDELGRPFQVDQVLFVNTIPTVRVPDIADGASDIGKGDLTPGDNSAIPGVGGVTIDGRVSTWLEYDRNSRQTFRVEDDEDTSRTFYDGYNRVIRTVDPEGNTVENAYDDNNNLIESQATDVSQVGAVPDEIFVTTYFYDSLNRLVRHVDNLGQSQEHRYDSRDNLVASADSQGPVTGASITRRVFAGGSNTINDINDFGNVTTYSYDGLSRQLFEVKVLTTSGEGDGTNIGADIFGVKTTTPTPDPTQGSGDGLISKTYVYDDNSLLTSLTDDNGNQIRYTYDNLNRRVMETRGVCVPPMQADSCDPPTSIVIEYDTDHNPILLTDENGSVIQTTYDALNRVTSSEVITQATGITGTTEVTYEYDGLSRQVRATDDNDPNNPNDDSVITHAYDSLGRLIEETQQINPTLPVNATSSSWRAEGLRIEIVYPNDRVITMTYDLLDRTHQVGDDGAAQPIADYSYLGPWRVAERDYLNGTRLTYLNDGGTADVGYDGLRRVIQVRHLRTDDSNIVGFTHTYDRMNNKETADKIHDPINNETFEYDSAYRLTTFSRPAGASMPPEHNNFTLDGAGNWKQVDGETRLHSSFNEVYERNDGTPVSITYDENGNMTDNGEFEYRWDYRNRLVQVVETASGHVLARYTYDAMDRRISKVVTTTLPAPSLVLTKTAAPDPVLVGDPLTYTIVLANNGDADATGIVITDTLDGNATFVSASDGGTHVGGVVTWTAGPLSPGQSLTRTLVVEVGDVPDQTVLSNTAEASSAEGAGASDTVTTTVMVEPEPEPTIYLPVVLNAGGNHANSPALPSTQAAAANKPVRQPMAGGTPITTYYYYDAWQVIEERDGGDGLTQQYVYGATDIDEILVMDQNLDGNNSATGGGDERFYYHQDTMLSVFALTDGNGDIVEGYQYDAYGRTIVYEPGGNGVVDFGGDDVVTTGGSSAVGNPYLYTGRRLDSETGLYYYRTRYYDTELGRFISRDSLGFWGDPMALGNPMSYAGNNPANYNDPYGKDGTQMVLGPTGIAVGSDAYKDAPPKGTFGIKDAIWLKEGDVWRLYKWVPVPDPPEPPEPEEPAQPQPPAEEEKPPPEQGGEGGKGEGGKVPNQGNHQQGTGGAAPPAPRPANPEPPQPPPGGQPTTPPAIDWIERVLNAGGNIPNLPPFVDQYLKGLAVGAGAAGRGGAGILNRRICRLECLCGGSALT